MDNNRPFQGLKVMELGDFISVGYAGKFLADLGADVIKVENPQCGDTVRSHGPFPDDISNKEKSGLHLFLNTNKRSITLDTLVRELLEQNVRPIDFR
jgi:crotonobetainyl-CoA:carnitine CoA-transferase CaiB-like acyl-CoA transferase